MKMTRVALAPIAVTLLLVFTVAACEQAAIEDNRRQVQQQQQMIEETQKELADIQAQQQRSYGPPPAETKNAAGSCDKKVMETATRRGGDAFAEGNLQKALGYYKDALTACPDSAKSDMNVGRTYEALGNRDAAIRYYRKAASSGGSDPDSVQEGRVALSRLGISN